MSYKKDNKIKSNFTTITISLASPEAILERSSGEVLKPEPLTTGPISLSVMVYFASVFLVR